MRRTIIFTLLLLVTLTVIATACSTPPTPTPTPRPTLPPTPLPPPTTVPTAAPTATRQPTVTLVPTQTLVPTITPTLPPTMTPLPPTRTAVPATRRPAATATSPKPPAPKGSVVYHINDGGIDRLRALNLETNATSPLVDVGAVMDISLSTSAHIGEFSPDNSKFAYVYTRAAGDKNNLYVVDFTTNEKRGLIADSGISSPTWSPDGTKIAFIRMSNNQAFWSVDVINVDGSGRTSIKTNTQGEQYRGGLSWSRQNVFALAMNTTGQSNIFTMYSDGGIIRNLTNSPADNIAPVWSPDGKMLAFTSMRTGPAQIYVVNADGTGLKKVSQTNVQDFSPAWSPDGKWLAFASSRTGTTGVYIMDLNGGNVKFLADGDHPTWSH